MEELAPLTCFDSTDSRVNFHQLLYINLRFPPVALRIVSQLLYLNPFCAVSNFLLCRKGLPCPLQLD